MDPLPKPRVTLRMEGKLLDFLVDTEAQHSVLLKAEGLLTSKRSWGGGGGQVPNNIFMDYPRPVDLGMGLVTNSFMVIP